MLSDVVKQWFAENSMGPMFQLSELQKQTGVKCKMVGNTVTFDRNGSNHPVAIDLDMKVLEIGTWNHIRNELPKTPPLGAFPPGSPKTVVVNNNDEEVTILEEHDEAN